MMTTTTRMMMMMIMKTTMMTMKLMMTTLLQTMIGWQRAKRWKKKVDGNNVATRHPIWKLEQGKACIYIHIVLYILIV